MIDGLRYTRRGARGLLGLAAFCAAGAQAQPTEAGAVVLGPSERHSAAHEATAEHRYVIEAVEGRSYLVTLRQQGFDFVLELADPAGAARSYNSPLRRDASEFLLIENAAGGRYRLRVLAEDHTGARGAHSIELTDLAGSGEPARIEAWRLMTRGAAANFSAGQAGWAEAVSVYERAAEAWLDLGATRERAQALFSAATIEYRQRFAWQRAEELAATAAEIYGDLNEDALRANAVHLEGAALVERALETAQSSTSAAVSIEANTLFDRAIALMEQARTTHEQLGNVYDLGLVVNNLGYTNYNRGRFDEARRFHEQAAALLQSVAEWEGELRPLANLALLDVERGYGGVETLERILEVLPEDRLLDYRAHTLGNLGAAQQLSGQSERALGTLAEAMRLQRMLEDGQGEATSLRRIGEAYFALGELALARRYLERALPLAVETNDGRNEERVLRALGNVAYLDSDYESALAMHRRALESSVSTTDRSRLLALIARDLASLGRYAEAVAEARAALEEAAQAGSELLLADARLALGGAVAGLAEPREAAEQLELARAVYARFGLAMHEAEARRMLALVARAAGDFDLALEHGERALSLIESARSRVAAPELRAFFSAARQDYYDEHIDLLMSLHARTADERYTHMALRTDERRRARTIGELLAGAEIEPAGDDDQRLVERRALYDRLAEFARERDAVLEQDLSADEQAERLAPLLSELAAVEHSINLLEIELARTSHALTGVRAGEPPSVAELQSALDADSVLLQYALGTKRSHVWAMTRERLVAVELADRETIEAAAHEALAALSSPSAGVPRARLEVLASLIIEPVAAELDKPRLLLALDGALQYIPFAALPTPGRGSDAATLLDAHEVVELPSMSVLMTLRARADGRHPSRTLAVFADPVVESGDSRFERPAAAAEPRFAALDARFSVAPDLHRLPSTGWEAEAIAGLVDEPERLVARGFDASLKTLRETDLGAFRYLHFATHGLIDSRYPALSALSLSTYDESGVPREGFLRLHDVYGLDLRADLVVLSACETALGRQVRGEGLVGLTQGFLSAGANGVVASLWQVPDRATAELMARLYEHLLDDGDRPAEALRKAQLSMAAQRRWSHPYYWSGFVLLGDWQ